MPVLIEQSALGHLVTRAKKQPPASRDGFIREQLRVMERGGKLVRTGRSGTAVSRLSDFDFAEIKGILCPHCRDGIRDFYECEPGGRGYVHAIPATHSHVVCAANAFRRRRYVPPA